jgi:predicted LPLAT superfamily acyltransferase
MTTREQWLAQPERSNVLAIRLMAWVTLNVGRRAGRLLLYPICFYFLLFSQRARRASKMYLRRALGREPTWGDLFRHYYWFAAITLDRTFFLSDRFEGFDIRIFDEDLLTQVRAQGGGCFLLGAHIGSFEALRGCGAQRTGLRVRMVMFEDNARKLNSVFSALNPHWSEDIIALGQLDSMLRVEEALDQGDIVGMLGDRTLSLDGQTRASFFGEQAAFATAPFRIAAMLRRPIILMCGLYRGGNRYDLYFERIYDGAAVARSERDVVLKQMISLYAERLEHYCRLAPYNWFNFYDFWQPQETAAHEQG